MKITWQKIKWLFVGALLSANIFVWFNFFGNKNHDFLTLAVLNVGQGDAIFVEDTTGHQILIDGGPDQKILAELPKLMSVTDRSIDLLILTHPHADHLTGLVEILKRYRVAGVLESGAIYDSATYDEWHRLLVEKQIPIIIAKRGEVIKLADGAELEVLTPFASWQNRGAKNIHDSMIVAKLVVASSSVALLTGDMEGELENDLLTTSADVSAPILKVGHHGSKTSTGERFLHDVTPRWAVISVGAKNRYGHPASQTLETLAKFGVETLRTDEAGTIVFHIESGLDKPIINQIE